MRRIMWIEKPAIRKGETSTERYLRLTPERFRRELDILCPRHPHSRWRNDAALMKSNIAYLASREFSTDLRRPRKP